VATLFVLLRYLRPLPCHVHFWFGIYWLCFLCQINLRQTAAHVVFCIIYIDHLLSQTIDTWTFLLQFMDGAVYGWLVATSVIVGCSSRPVIGVVAPFGCRLSDCYHRYGHWPGVHEVVSCLCSSLYEWPCFDSAKKASVVQWRRVYLGRHYCVNIHEAVVFCCSRVSCHTDFACFLFRQEVCTKLLVYLLLWHAQVIINFIWKN
jgi:hypothetical protein